MKKGRTGNYCLGSKLCAESHYRPPLFKEKSDVITETAGEFVSASPVRHRFRLTTGRIRSAAHTGKFRNSTGVAAAPPSTRSLDLLKRRDYGSAAQ